MIIFGWPLPSLLSNVKVEEVSLQSVTIKDIYFTIICSLAIRIMQVKISEIPSYSRKMAIIKKSGDKH